MLRHPIFRMLFGLTVGFVVATITITAVERFPDDSELAPAIAGEPDYEGFCRRDGDDLRAVNVFDDAYGWRCSGFTGGLWATTDIDTGQVCAWQFGRDVEARVIDDSSRDGWVCVES